MHRSNHLQVDTQDERYEYTPSGIRTIVAPNLAPDGVVLKLVNPAALRALDELAAADEAREEEEPTTEWTPTENNLGNLGSRPAGSSHAPRGNEDLWNHAQIEALLALEQVAPRKAPADIGHAPVETADARNVDGSEFDSCADAWLLADDDTRHREFSEVARETRAATEWTAGTWLTVAGAVVAAESAIVLLATLNP